MKKSNHSYIRYNHNGSYTIALYFDEEDKVTIILFSEKGL